MHRCLGILVTVLLAAQPVVASEGMESELEEMRALVDGLKEKVDAQEEQLSHQGELLEQAQSRMREDTGSKSGLEEVVNRLHVEGLAAASWAYGLNRPSYPDGDKENQGFDLQQAHTRPLSGESGGFLPYQGDHNDIKVDQIVFDLGIESTKENPAGLNFGIVFGNTASTLGQGVPIIRGDSDGGFSPLEGFGSRRNGRDSASDYYIYEANLTYKMSCECGDTDFTLGKFRTPVGIESFRLDENYNYTRGNVFSFLQPIDHNGFTASGNLGPVGLTIGAVTSIMSMDSAPSVNDSYGGLFSAEIGDDQWGARTTFLYGAEGGDADEMGIFDTVLTYNPTASLGMWMNSTYVFETGSARDAWGMALAARYQLPWDVGFSLRGEYLEDDVDATGDGDVFGIGSSTNGTEIWSLTSTLDWSLTSDLTLFAEYRWDKANERGIKEFSEGADTPGGGDDSQSVVLLGAVLEF